MTHRKCSQFPPNTYDTARALSNFVESFSVRSLKMAFSSPGRDAAEDIIWRSNGEPSPFRRPYQRRTVAVGACAMWLWPGNENAELTVRIINAKLTTYGRWDGSEMAMMNPYCPPARTSDCVNRTTSSDDVPVWL